jgi:hypothetical protein
VEESAWLPKLSASTVGSCTNSSYEDLEIVRHLLLQAREAGLDQTKVPFLVRPGSEQIRATAEYSGILETLKQTGATILSNSCGPCVGQWDRQDVNVKGAEKNPVISSFSRNFTALMTATPRRILLLHHPRWQQAGSRWLPQEQVVADILQVAPILVPRLAGEMWSVVHFPWTLTMTCMSVALPVSQASNGFRS